MAIARPVTKTIISTTQWGVPITDAVNANTTDVAALKAWKTGFARGQGMLGGGGNYTAGQTIGTLVIPASSVARRIIATLHLYIGFTAGNDIQFQFNGVTAIIHRTPSVAGSITVEMTVPNYDLAANTACTLGAVVQGGGTVTTYGDPYFNQVLWSSMGS